MRSAIYFLLAALLMTGARAECKDGVEFTKVQDLKADTVSVNRPIKQKWAVVIGISSFKDRNFSTETPNAKAARDFYDYLTDKKAGRFDVEHVKLLTDEAATQRAILDSLGPRWLGSVAGKDDLVVVYIATDGFPTTDGGTYIAAYDCSMDNIYGTCISMRELMQNLRKSVQSDRIVLVLQSNYSGAADLTAGAKSLTPKKSYNLDLSQVMLGKGFVVLTSSKSDQISIGDTFTQNLISALRTDGGMIPLQTAFGKAKEQTEYDTTYKMNPAKTQTPVLKSEWTGTDIILGTPPAERVSNLPADVENFLGAESHYLKASKFAVDGNLDAAIAEYKLAIAADANYADAIADYGVALGLKGNWQEALTQLNRAVELQPKDVLYRTNLARAYDQLGQRGECIKQLEYAYSLNPKDSAVLRALASKAIGAKDYATAAKLLNEALALYPNNASLHDRLSYADSMIGNLDDALKHAQQATKLDPQLASAWLNKGSIEMAQSNLVDALESYRAALKADPRNADAWFLLSQANEKRGDMDGMREALSKFLAVCPPSDARGETARKKLAEMQHAQ
jgi:tetratricopeptide (TPR) repeat protein